MCICVGGTVGNEDINKSAGVNAIVVLEVDGKAVFNNLRRCDGHIFFFLLFSPRCKFSGRLFPVLKARVSVLIHEVIKSLSAYIAVILSRIVVTQVESFATFACVSR